MFNFELIETADSLTQKMERKTAETLFDMGVKYIEGYLAIKEVLVPESEYTGETDELYEDHQLNVIEDIVYSKLDEGTLAKIAQYADSNSFGSDKNALRISGSVKLSKHFINLAEKQLEMYMPLSVVQMEEWNTLVVEVLNNFVYSFATNYGIQETAKAIRNKYSSVPIEPSVLSYTQIKERDIEKLILWLDNLASKYYPTLTVFEKYPEESRNFVSMFPEELVSRLIDVADSVLLTDITGALQGTVQPDLELIERIEARASRELGEV